jgi:hypothetical protein
MVYAISFFICGGAFICAGSAQTPFGKKEEGRAWANAALSLAVRATETVATSGNLLTWWSQMNIVSHPPSVAVRVQLHVRIYKTVSLLG